ncbi:alpha/beta hydrolase [Geobacter anodireducens]|nr:alpha/beta hydrolase [Geobacter anodireducens]
MASTASGSCFAHSPDTLIHYRTHGCGPVHVVFIHGFAAALTTWDDLAPLFPPDRFTLYLIDLKGFGFSSKPRCGSYSLEEQAAVVTAFIKAQGLRQVVLAGHSLGGGIALLVALRAGERGDDGLIGRLVLLDCAAYPQRLPRFMRLLRVPVLARLGMALIPVRLIVKATLRAVFEDPAAITAERILRYETCFGRRGIARVLIRTVRELSRTDASTVIQRYGAIDIPALIIWGENDRIVRPAQGRRLAEDLPSARLAVIGTCGHNPHEEQPLRTYELMREFIEQEEEKGEGAGTAQRGRWPAQ